MLVYHTITRTSMKIMEFCLFFFVQSIQAIYGEFCECDRISCPRKNDQVCSGLLFDPNSPKAIASTNYYFVLHNISGPSHGECACNKTCICKEGWTGEDCSCTTEIKNCLINNVS